VLGFQTKVKWRCGVFWVSQFTMPPYYYSDTCVYVGYSLATLFLTSLSATFGTMCAIYYTDVYPREKQIVQLRADLELFEGELDTVRAEESQEHSRRHRAEADSNQLRNDLLVAQGELQRVRDELHVAKRDNEIYTVAVYISIIIMGFYGIYCIVGSFGTSDRTEL
jgi:hypothetical protein